MLGNYYDDDESSDSEDDEKPNPKMPGCKYDFTQNKYVPDENITIVGQDIKDRKCGGNRRKRANKKKSAKRKTANKKKRSAKRKTTKKRAARKTK